MFNISEKTKNNITYIEIENVITNELVEIIPSLGANVNNLVLQKNGRLYSLLKSRESSSDFTGNNIFFNAKLFPFPNRLENGRFVFNNVKYEIDQNFINENNACHGFVFNKEFKIIDKVVHLDFAEITFGYEYLGNNLGYPFPFKILVVHRLENKSGYTCITKVENIGDNDMPMGDGWHPFIKINDCVGELFLKFNSEKIIDVNEKMIPNGFSETFNEFDELNKINDKSFDNCFLLKMNGSIHNTEIYDKNRDLKVIIWQETGAEKYNYLQIYIPPERDSIAVEPMTCNINAFNNKEGLIVLRSGDVFEAKYGIRLY